MAGHGAWLLLADATIRSVLHMDPGPLDDETWVAHVIMAESVRNIFLGNLQKALGLSTGRE